MKYFTLCFSLLFLQANAQTITDEDLAYRWAPIHYQDTDNSNAKADFITRVDYDGDYICTNNWENLDKGDLAAYVYYSVVETSTTWFIVYAFYHPRDWTDHSFDQEHENDMEGLLEIIKKDGTTYGQMQAMITVAHNDFYSFNVPGSGLSNGHEDIDGIVSFQSYDGDMHPKTSEEPKGHPIKAFPYISDFHGNANEDGIIYFPSKTTAEIPSSGNDRDVKYKLLNFQTFNLWLLQIFESLQTRDKANTFAKWGTLKGDEGGSCGDGITVTCAEDAAHLPWGWDDEDDGPNYAGALAIDPASLVSYYFSGLGNFSLKYTRNKYISDLKAQGFTNTFKPNGWPSQVNFTDLFAKLAPVLIIHTPARTDVQIRN